MQRFKILVCSAATVLVIPIAETQAADHPNLDIRLLVRSLRADSARLYREIRATAFQRPDFKGLLQDADDLNVLAENLERMVYRRANLRLIRRDVVEFDRTLQILARTAKANVIAKKSPVNNQDRSQNGYVWSEDCYRSPVFPGRELLVLFDDVAELLFDLKNQLGIRPAPVRQAQPGQMQPRQMQPGQIQPGQPQPQPGQRQPGAVQPQPGQPLPSQLLPKRKSNGPIIRNNNGVPPLPGPPEMNRKKSQTPVPAM